MLGIEDYVGTLEPGKFADFVVLSDNPLEVDPMAIKDIFIDYRIGSKGIYVQTADIVALYDWNSGNFYLPIGARIDKVWVLE